MKSISNNPERFEGRKSNNINIARALVLGAVFASAYTVTAFAQKGVVNADNVNLRTDANPDSSVIGLVNTGDEVEVTSLAGDYYQVTVNGQQRLYIHTDYLDVEGSETTAPIEEDGVQNSTGGDDIYASNTYAIINSSDGLNLRTDPSIDADVISTLPDGAAVDVIESWPVWTKVSIDGTVGYMKTEYVELHNGQKPEQLAATSLGYSVVAYGKKFLGTPYVWGGTNLSRGVDCSGFVYSVYRHFGIYLDRTSAAMGRDGYRVSKSSLRAGDLVLFDTSGPNNGRISHVGIYIGNGQFMHSSSGNRRGVTISSLSESYYQRTYVTARRVI